MIGIVCFAVEGPRYRGSRLSLITTGYSLIMRQKAAGQRSRRQTAPSGRALELKVREATELETIPDSLDSITDIHNELEFAQWYSEVEESLLEASYDEYQ